MSLCLQVTDYHYVFQVLSMAMQLLTFAVDTEATFTSTERVRYYIKVSVHCAVLLLLHCIMYTLYVSKVNNAYQRQFAYFILRL